MSELTSTAAAWRSRRLDPGAAAYLLEIGAAALGRVGRLPDPPTRLAETVDQSWRECLHARGLGVGRSLVSSLDHLDPAQVFHLHNYATYLAGKGGPRNQRQALIIQDAVCAARDAAAANEPAGYPARHTAARQAHEVAAWIAGQLGHDSGRPAEWEEFSTAALRHVRAVLGNPSFAALLRESEPGTRPGQAPDRTGGAGPGTGLAEVAARLLAAVALIVSRGDGLSPSERSTLDLLLRLGSLQAQRWPGPVGARLRQDLPTSTVDVLRERLAPKGDPAPRRRRARTPV